MDILIDRCAGLDVHKKSVVGCVRKPGTQRKRTKEICTFKTTMSGLQALDAWLKENSVTHVAMESTGVYWRPVYTILEHDYVVLLVNARHIKNVPGRKTDVRDCDWIAQLLECGLLRASFIPPSEIRDLRDVTRYRKSLIRERSRHVNRVAKTLELANIKLGSVVADIMGVTGRAILDALVCGEEDPEVLAAFAKGTLRKKQAELEEAVVGRMTPHYRFLIGQQLRVIDDTAQHIVVLDTRIEEMMCPFKAACVIVETMPGVSQRSAQVIIAEIGVDMSRFPSASHLASWARVCPGNHESAGKRKSTATGHANVWLRATLSETAWAAARTKRSYYSALFYRHKARKGSKVAIKVVQHAMLVAIWHMLSKQQPHDDLGHDYFQQHNKEGIRRHHIRQLKRLGYEVQLKEEAA